MSGTCQVGNPDYQYVYCPNYGAAVAFAILFTSTTLFHVWQAAAYKKTFAAVMIMGGVWEVFGYIIRSVSIKNGTVAGLYTGQMMLILLAPLWINAFIYMLVGRMIHFFMDDDRIFGIKARRMGLIFVIFDIIAFLVQGTGGSLTATTDIQTQINGLHIYTAGVALQIAFNVFFLAVVVRFQLMSAYLLRGGEQSMALNTRGSAPVTSPSRSFGDAVWLLRLVYGIILIILFRNFYRLAEFAGGLGNTVMTHEWYAYVFDAVPMFLALVILNVWHPGQKLQGPRCDFTEEDQARKQARAARKAAKMDQKEANVSTTEVYDRV